MRNYIKSGSGVTSIGNVTGLQEALDLKTSIGKKTVTPINAVAASAWMNIINNPVDGDTVTMGGVTYAFKTVISQAYDVLINTTPALTVQNLIIAVNKLSGEGTVYGAGTIANPLVTIVLGYGSNFYLYSRIKGVVNNGLSLSKSSTLPSWMEFNRTTPTTVTSGGIDGTVGKDMEMFFVNSIMYVSVGESTIHTANWVRSSFSLF